MKALRRIGSKMKETAKHLSRKGIRLAGDRLRSLLGAAAIFLAAICASAAPDGDQAVTPAPAAMPETPMGFTGVGPVISGSVSYDDMPSKARKFL